MYVKPEMILEAKKMDLYTYLLNFEPDELVRFSGNTYTTRTHDSLKISNGKWMWWSRGIGGRTALDYLIKVKGMSFVDAVQTIVGCSPITTPVSPKPKEVADRPLPLPKRSLNTDKIRAYLSGRGIDDEIIDYCIKNKLIFESLDYNNVVFIGYDEKNTPRYAAYRSTNHLKIMGDCSGSKKEYPFKIASGKDDKIHLFECAIDLLSYATEVVDGFVIDANIGTLQKSERNFAKEHLEILNKYCNSKDIVIFDRGYPSKEMISILSKMQCKYLMRLQASSFKEVSENSGSDFDIKIKYQNTEYPVRVIRITLNTGEIETLITNLTRKQFKIHEFKKLYALRWSVETTYNTIKNKLLIEKFSGRTVLSIHQDFYATMFLMNCVAAISSEVNDEIRKEKSSCKYDYKANRNLIVGYMKHRLSSILLKTNVVIKKLCKKLIQLCCKQPVNQFANSVNSNVKYVPSVTAPGEFVAVVTNCQENDFLLLNCSGITKSQELLNFISDIIADGQIPVNIGKGTGAKAVLLDIPKMHFVFFESTCFYVPKILRDEIECCVWNENDRKRV